MLPHHSHLPLTGFIVAVCVISTSSVVDALTWDAGGIDPHWSTPENWVGDVAPTNDGSADITFDTYPPATPVTQMPWSIRSLNLSGNLWNMAIAGDPITLGEGGLNATPINASTSTPTLIWNDLNLSASQDWRSTMPLFEVIGDISTNGHHLTIETSGEFLISGNANFTGGLTKAGSGYLFFTDTPTATGDVSVKAGVLSVASPIAGGIGLDGGVIELRGDRELASLIAPGSTGGDLVWRDQSAITFGGTNQLNIGSLGMTGPLRLGASVNSTITSATSVVPDSTTQTLHFGAGDAALTVNSVISDSPAGPTNLTFSGNGTTILNASNTHTGHTTVSGGRVDANTPTAFGSAATATTITGGEVYVNTDTNEPFIVEGGSLLAEQYIGSTFHISGGYVVLKNYDTDPTFDNDITMSGGILSYGVGTSSTGTVTGTINLENGGRAVIRAHPAKREIVLAGPIQGDGTVVLESLYGKIEVQTTMTHTGDTVIYSDQGLNSFINLGVSFESTQAFGGDLILDGGILRNNAPNAVPNLIMAGGRLEGTAPLTVANPRMNLAAGEIDFPGGLIGINQIVKTELADASLLNLGNQINPTVTVEQGRLIIGTAAADSINGAVSIPQGANAEIGITGYPAAMVDIQLNNGTGISYSGALSNREIGHLGGTVDLGNIGAYIGGTDIKDSYSDHYLNISGRITGGGLTKVNKSTLIISGSDNDYTGVTTIAEGVLNITGTGRLSTTESILIQGHSVLRIDNGTVTTNQDHVGDNVPIRMDNGVIEFISPTDLTSFDETLGPLNLESGAAVIISDQKPYGQATPQSIVFAEVNRDRSATLAFQTEHGRLGVVDGHRIGFTNAPVVTNGIIGGWAVAVNPQFNDVDFVTYDPVLGVTALPEVGRPNDLNTADATGNVLLTANSTLTADRSIYSLDMGRYNVDLGGNTLTIESGGLLMGEPGWAPEVSNGRLTAGAGISELIIHMGSTNHSRGGVIRADIVDSSGGPTDLVVSRFWTTTSTYVELYGNNTYSGTTYLNAGAGAHIFTPGAAPNGNNVVLNGGEYSVQIDSGQVVLGDITIRNEGELITRRYNGVRADVIHAESGSMRADLFGHFPIVKSTTGLFTIGYASADNQELTNTNYTGNIDIQNGIVVVEPLWGLGDGVVTIRDGGRLVMDRPDSAQDSIVHGKIVMDGGEFAVGRRPDAILNDPFTVVADSRVLTFYGLARRIYYPHNIRDPFEPRHVTLAGETTLVNGSTLTALGEGTLSITGDLLIQEGAKVTGNVVVQPSTGRHVRGNGTIEGEVVINAGAVLMPGTEIGQIIVDGGYSQLPGGLLEIELTGQGGSPGTDFDHLLISETAQLGGDLSVLLATGFMPAAGDYFTIINARSIVGNFDALYLPAIDSDLEWVIIPTDTSLTLQVRSTLAGDLNGDGFVGVDDLNILLINWNQNVTPGDLSSGDPSGEGFVGVDDLNIVLINWNAGTPPFAKASNAIPEPSTVVILAVCAVTLLRRVA